MRESKGMKGKIGSEWSYFKKNREISLLLLPGILKLFIFAYLPMFGVIVAFKNYRFDQGILGSDWIGFKNFEYLFSTEIAWRITRNTFLYESGYIIFTLVFSLTAAVLLNEIGKKYLKYYQTALFLPHFLSWVVVFYVTHSFLDHENGFLNQWIQAIGWEAHLWYFEKEHWPYILNSAALWKRIGYSTLIYYAGIMSINQEYYEAARMDGANRFKMAVKITIPMLTPLIIILLILQIGDLFNGDFGLHFFIPNNSGLIYPTTDIINTFVYRALTSLGDIGMSSAAGLYQSMVGLVLVITANYIVKKINEENSLW